jgi:hypothetical protein
MGAQGKLLADGASTKKPPARRSTRTARADSTEDIAQLTPLLAQDESIRDCVGCGAKFVSSRDGDDYCSQAACQLKARATR